jgi:hypothetical protein
LLILQFHTGTETGLQCCTGGVIGPYLTKLHTYDKFIYITSPVRLKMSTDIKITFLFRYLKKCCPESYANTKMFSHEALQCIVDTSDDFFNDVRDDASSISILCVARGICKLRRHDLVGLVCRYYHATEARGCF